jgi:hypothetical protein
LKYSILLNKNSFAPPKRKDPSFIAAFLNDVENTLDDGIMLHIYDKENCV